MPRSRSRIDGAGREKQSRMASRGRKQSDGDRPAPRVEASASERIRERLRKAGTRFYANDCIAAFIQPGEQEQLVDEVTTKMKAVLDSLVIDTDNDHNTQDTARRVAKMYVNEISAAATGRSRGSPSSPMSPVSMS